MTRPRTVGYWLEESVELVDRDAPQYATFAQAFSARRVGQAMAQKCLFFVQSGSVKDWGCDWGGRSIYRVGESDAFH